MNRTETAASVLADDAAETMPDVQIVTLPRVRLTVPGLEGRDTVAYLEIEKARFTFATLAPAESLIWWAFFAGFRFAQSKAGADGAANPPGWSSE